MSVQDSIESGMESEAGGQVEETMVDGCNAKS